jgi:hypothetical protein
MGDAGEWASEAGIGHCAHILLVEVKAMDQNHRSLVLESARNTPGQVTSCGSTVNLLV